jgi:hypothetical protein
MMESSFSRHGLPIGPERQFKTAAWFSGFVCQAARIVLAVNCG